MKKKFGKLGLILALTMTASMIAGCGGDSNSGGGDKTSDCPNSGDPIKVATMTDTEGGTLGKVIVLALQDGGFEVEDQTQTLGSTKLVREVAVNKDANITVNYTGNGMYLMDEVGKPEWLDYQNP